MGRGAPRVQSYDARASTCDKALGGFGIDYQPDGGLWRSRNLN